MEGPTGEREERTEGVRRDMKVARYEDEAEMEQGGQGCIPVCL